MALVKAYGLNRIGFEAIIPEKGLAEMVKNSPGSNFGSVHLWRRVLPPGRPDGTHLGRADQAAEIFAFDVLAQNPDRRAGNPNLWARSNRLGVYDQEQAFSFLSVPIVGGTPKPWSVANQSESFGFLKQHIFYHSLRGGPLNLGPFKETFGALTEKQFEAILTPFRRSGGVWAIFAGRLPRISARLANRPRDWQIILNTYCDETHIQQHHTPLRS